MFFSILFWYSLVLPTNEWVKHIQFIFYDRQFAYRRAKKKHDRATNKSISQCVLTDSERVEWDGMRKEKKRSSTRFEISCLHFFWKKGENKRVLYWRLTFFLKRHTHVYAIQSKQNQHDTCERKLQKRQIELKWRNVKKKKTHTHNKLCVHEKWTKEEKKMKYSELSIMYIEIQ